MHFTPTEAEQYVRMTLKQWGLSHVKLEWRTFQHLGDANPYTNTLRLSVKVLVSLATFTETVKHEIAHFLDFQERGSFLINGRHVAHGKNWRKWCKTLGIPARTKIPYCPNL